MCVCLYVRVRAYVGVISYAINFLNLCTQYYNLHPIELWVYPLELFSYPLGLKYPRLGNLELTYCF